MAIIDWPAVLTFRRFRLHLDTIARTGGPSLSGLVQVTSALAALWRVEATVPLDTPEKIKAARRLNAAMRGNVNVLRIDVAAAGILHGPTHTAGVNPWPGEAAAIPDLTPYGALPAAAATLVTVEAEAGVTASAIPGTHLAVGDHTHLVEACTVLGGPSRWQLTIWPPLREAPDIGDAWKFGAVLLCRPAGGMALAFDVDDHGFGTPLELDLLETLS